MEKTSKIKIYIACALTKAPPEFKAEVSRVKAIIVESHPEWEILEFYGLGTLPPDQDWRISRQDIQNAVGAHLVVAITDYDSTGMGIESGIRIALGLPLLSVARCDWLKTRMVTGPQQDWPQHCVFSRYEKLDELSDHIREAIAHFGIDPDAPRKLLTVAPHILNLYWDAIGLDSDSQTSPYRVFRVHDDPSSTPDAILRQPGARLAH